MQNWNAFWIVNSRTPSFFVYWSGVQIVGLKHRTKHSSLDWSIWHSFCSFFYSRTYTAHIQVSSLRHSCSKKVPVEKESSLSMGGAIIFLALFPQNYIHWQQHNMSCTCNTYSRIKKRKRYKLYSEYHRIIKLIKRQTLQSRLHTPLTFKMWIFAFLITTFIKVKKGNYFLCWIAVKIQMGGRWDG